MPVIIVPKPSKSFIDKLSLTYDVPANKHEEILTNATKLAENGYTKKIQLPELYERSYKCAIESNKTTLLIQIKPKGKFIHTHNFLRIEFNADKANMAEIKQILDLLLNNGYQRIIENGKVTKCEITTDVYFLHISQLIIHYPKYKKGNIHYNGQHIETINIGSTASGKRIKIYNKTLQLAEMGLSKKYSDMTRIEFTVKNIKTISELPNMTNLFAQLKVAAYPKHYVNSDFIIQCHLNMISTLGYTYALQKIKKSNPHLAKKLEYNILNNGMDGWWDPQKIWNGLYGSVDKLLLK